MALRKRRAPLPFRQGLAEIWQESKARNFTLFSLLSMTAYFMQELILKPYAGLAFGNTPGQSNQLLGAQNGGVFVGMLLVGIAATGLRIGSLRASVMAGCGGSLMALASAGRAEREGTRMGFWGATQAIAAGFGGLIESAVVDLAWSGVAVAFLDRAGRIKPSGEAIPPRWLSLAELDAQVQVDPARFTPWMRIYLAEGWGARARVPVSAR